MSAVRGRRVIQYILLLFRLNQMYYVFSMLCVCHATPTQKLFCLHIFCHAGSPQGLDCLSNTDILRTRRELVGFQMQTSKVLVVKNLRFFQNYGVPARTGGMGACWGSADKRKGDNFWRFCADVFHGRLLIFFSFI